MNFLDNIQDNSILIIPNNIKDKVLDYFNNSGLLCDVKITNFSELKKELLFDYDNQTINFVMHKYHVNYGVAKNYINNIYYLENEDYQDNKLKVLCDIKHDLEDNNLLIKDNLFIDLLKSKSIVYVYGYDYINKFNNYLLDLIREYKEVIVVDKERHEYKHDVYHYKTIEEEVLALAENISKLVNDGVSLDKIYITNYSDEYYFTMHKIFKLYEIPYFIRSETSLYDTVIGHYFLDNLDDDLDKLLSDIREKYDCDNNEYNKSVYSKLINLLNTYYWCDEITVVSELLTEEMKNTKISSRHYNKEIVTTNIIDNIFNDDEYVFLIGFNLGSVPRIKKDEDYIDDKIKTRLMTTSLEDNEINKNVSIQAIKNIKNLYISYKDSSLSGELYPSFLIDGDYLVKKDCEFGYSEYSDKVNKLLLAKKIDNLIKFNEKDDTLSVLNNNYKINYKEYDNGFTGVNESSIQEKLRTFSYSNISTYFKCPFRFYLDYFFRLNEYEESLATFIGSLFHKVMEECINDETKDIDHVYDEFVKKHENDMVLGAKERFFIERVRNEVHFIIDNIREQYKHSSHDKSKEWHEEKITFASEDLDINLAKEVVITGIVDKCLVIDNDILVIDYKTGNSAVIRKDLFQFGIDIQLPIYLYLLKNLNKEYNIVGLYLQHILTGFINDTDLDKNTVDEVKINRLKLDGITLDDDTKVSEFDDDYYSSSVIKGLKKKQDGSWYSNSNTITYEEQEELYNLIKTKIEECINSVTKGEFPIKPLNVDKKVAHCEYCDYKDICFRKDSDVNYQYIVKEGDTNE